MSIRTLKQILASLSLLLSLSMAMQAQTDQPIRTTNEWVRVAAIQCPSVMGKTAENIANITKLVRQAAQRGAKIVVLPECSVQGYLDPITWTSWSKADTVASSPGTAAWRRCLKPFPVMTS